MKKSLVVTFFAFIIFLGGFAGSVSLAQVIITEVYIYGSDEYIELANVSDQGFVGDLVLSGVNNYANRTSDTIRVSDVDLDPGEILIVGKRPAQLDNYEGNFIFEDNIKLADSRAANIFLFSDERLLDSFTVSESEVSASANKHRAFHKYWDGNGWETAVVDEDTTSVDNGYANPGQLYQYQDGKRSIWTIGSEGTGTGESETGSHNQSGSNSIDDFVCDDSAPVMISELYQGEKYADYIELFVNKNWSGGIMITGSALSKTIVLDERERAKNNYYLVTQDAHRLQHEHQIYVDANLSLQKGDMFLMTTSGQVLSSYEITALQEANYSYERDDCHYNFDSDQEASPGFGREFLSYIRTQTLVKEIEIEVCQDDSTANSGSNAGSGSNDGGIDYTSLQFTIHAVDYSGPSGGEQDIHISYDSGDQLIDLSTLRIRVIDEAARRIASSGDRSYYKNKLIDGLIEPGEDMIVVKKFGFFKTKETCVQLLKPADSLLPEDVVYDEYCYDPNEGPAQNTGLVRTGTIPDLRISLLDYNPPGPDKDNERVGLRLLSGDRVDLTGWYLRYNDEYQKKFIFTTGTVLSGEDYIVRDDFQMLNSRPVCVQLYHPGEELVDTACYDPAQHPSPFEPLKPVIDYKTLKFSILAVDPSDTDAQRVRLRFDGGTSEAIDLSLFRLRVGAVNKTISGQVFSGETIDLVGRFGIPKTISRCIALIHALDKREYARFCTNPTRETDNADEGDLDEEYYSYRIKIVDLVYDPPGSDRNRETVTLYNSGNSDIDLSKLVLHFDGKNRKLNGVLGYGQTLTITGDFQMPNFVPTCVQVKYKDHSYDEYCYDPNEEILLSGVVEELFDQTNRSGLQIVGILPNPPGRDIKGENEMLNLYRSGENPIELPDEVYLRIGRTKIPLAGRVLIPGENIFPSSHTLPNTPQCLSLRVGASEIDHLCHPQAKDGTRYYHPRLGIGPRTIPEDLMQALDFNTDVLAKLRVQHIGKQTCLVFDGVAIRCLSAQQTATSKKNRSLLTLANAYINRIHNLYYKNELFASSLAPRLRSYLLLSQEIKNDRLDNMRKLGTQVRPTELSRYVELVYIRKPEEYLLDELGSGLFGATAMSKFYQKIYE